MKVEKAKKRAHTGPSTDSRREAHVERETDEPENVEIEGVEQLRVHLDAVAKDRTRGEAANANPGRAEPTQSDAPSSNSTSELCEYFKLTLCHEDFAVHFVGVWSVLKLQYVGSALCLRRGDACRDTVSSIGVTRGSSFPETVNGMLHVRAFRHALSIHERRGKFLPEYGNGGGGPLGGGDVKEVWFAGSHSDM